MNTAAHLLLILAWELTSRYVVPARFLPPPSLILSAFVSLTLSGELPRQLLQSAGVVSAGFGLAAVTGIAAGAAMGMFPAVRRIFDPYVSAFYAMPTVAMVPLVILWLGLGFEAKVFLTWLVAVFPVVINASAGIASVAPAHIETALAFRCSRWQVFRRVILPAAVPFFIAGIRLGLGRALVGAVVAEMFTALSGLGYLIVLYGNTFRTAELFVPILVLAGISVAATSLIHRFERKVAPWRFVRE